MPHLKFNGDASTHLAQFQSRSLLLRNGTNEWVTETVISHLKALNVMSIWEPSAGEGGMAQVLAGAGFAVTATDLSGGVNFFDERTWLRPGVCCDAIAANPPYGLQGKLAERLIERGLEPMRPCQGAVAR